MSLDGSNILENFKETKRILSNTSILLQTADSLMIKNGWQSEGQGVRESSSDLKNSARWVPWTLYRFYKKGEILRRAFISILLDNQPEDEYGLVEPLITAGYFDIAAQEHWYYHWSQLYAYVSDKDERGDGRIIELPFDADWRKRVPSSSVGGKPIGAAKCFAVPLTSVKSSQDLEAKIVSPLLKLLE